MPLQTTIKEYSKGIWGDLFLTHSKSAGHRILSFYLLAHDPRPCWFLRLFTTFSKECLRFVATSWIHEDKKNWRIIKLECDTSGIHSTGNIMNTWRSYTVKKVIVFPPPAGMSLTKVSLASNLFLQSTRYCGKESPRNKNAVFDWFLIDMHLKFQGL